MSHNSIEFIFFGTSPVAVGVLEALKSEGYIPVLIVTTPDAPAGRKLQLTSPPAKLWALENKIPVLQPAKLDKEFIYALHPTPYTLFLVASYGLIIPKRVLALPQYGTLNVHPSLLPKYRGPSPIQTAILNGDTETGVNIMLMDAKMDEGPILVEERVTLDGTEVNEKLEIKLATIGGKLLARVIPDWIVGKITPRPQDHTLATYTRKFEKSDGFICPAFLEGYGTPHTDPEHEDDPLAAERKIRALGNTPGTYTIVTTRNNKDVRVKILGATVRDGQLIPFRVIPEGKKETSWEEFRRGNL